MDYLKKDITDISLREDREYYIGDIIQVKKPKWLNVKNGMLCGFNSITNKWIVKYFNTNSGIKYEEIEDEYIVKLKGTSIEINSEKSIHKYDLEINKFLNNKRDN